MLRDNFALQRNAKYVLNVICILEYNRCLKWGLMVLVVIYLYFKFGCDLKKMATPRFIKNMFYNQYFFSVNVPEWPSKKITRAIMLVIAKILVFDNVRDFFLSAIQPNMCKMFIDVVYVSVNVNHKQFKKKHQGLLNSLTHEF